MISALSSYASEVLMVEPLSFGFNLQTAADNEFQHLPVEQSLLDITLKAQEEFHNFRKKLCELGIVVQTFPSKAAQDLPDAVFPNNWFSVQPDKTLVLYPMYAQNRRLERTPEIIEYLTSRTSGFIDYSKYEAEGKFLEGTGSLVLDHDNKIAYACISHRTHPDLVENWCAQFGYELVLFEAKGLSGKLVYHTNVVMMLGSGFAVVSLESIQDSKQRNMVLEKLEKSNKRIIEISLEQMSNYCGNMLYLEGKSGILVVSQRAWGMLLEVQKKALEAVAHPLIVDIPTIETIGGGSVRCMLAELY